MAIGFTDLNGTQRIPDKGLTVNSSPDVHISKFGNGYEQRIENGINSLAQNFTVTFNDRTKAEIDARSQATRLTKMKFCDDIRLSGFAFTDEEKAAIPDRAGKAMTDEEIAALPEKLNWLKTATKEGE